MIWILVIIVLIIVALPLGAAAVMKKSYTIDESIDIDRPKSDVYSYIKYLKNQDNYSKWMQMDPQIKKEYSGEDGTVGFVSKWESKVKGVGTGEQEITKITEGERVDYEIRFLKPFTSTAPAYMSVADAGEGKTSVHWVFMGTMPYPMNLMMSQILPSIRNDLRTGLNNLKHILEENK